MIQWFKRRRARNVLERAGICPEHDIQREVNHDQYITSEGFILGRPYKRCPECVKQARSRDERKTAAKIAEARKILGLD